MLYGAKMRDYRYAASSIYTQARLHAKPVIIKNTSMIMRIHRLRMILLMSRESGKTIATEMMVATIVAIISN
jgi:hypothetical protein